MRVRVRVRGRAGGTASAVLLTCALAGGCTEQRPSIEPPASSSSAAPTASAGAAAPESAPQAEPTAAAPLPEGALRDLVPAPQEVAPPLVPLLQASGPRDAAAVAGFSADPAAAATDLASHGFTDAYVAQYASATDPRSLSVVVVRFATAEGAQADLAGDLAVPSGELVEVEPIGAASEVRRLTLPDDDAQDLVTVRFRSGTTTWLLAWRAPLPADAAVPVDLARTLAGRG